MMLTRFLVLILGAFTPPPMMDDPVEKMPLKFSGSREHSFSFPPIIVLTYQAAPTTDKAMATAAPIAAYIWGDIDPITLKEDRIKFQNLSGVSSGNNILRIRLTTQSQCAALGPIKRNKRLESHIL